ncbi:MAG: hypothetical protein AB1806_15250 [Acidobacteriota bacterium]
MRTFLVLVLAAGGAIIAASLGQRYINAVLASGRPDIAAWAGGYGYLAPLVGLLFALIVFGAIAASLQR